MMSAMFLPMTVKPTRQLPKITATLIDNIFTNDNILGTHLNGILFNNLSDHLPVFSEFLRWRVISLVAKMNVISLEGINNESVASFERELEKQTGKR